MKWLTISKNTAWSQQAIQKKAEDRIEGPAMSGSFAVLETAYDGKRGIICQNRRTGKRTGRRTYQEEDYRGQFRLCAVGV